MLFYVLSTLKSLTLAAQTLPIKREDTKIKNNTPLKFILITLLFLISENNSIYMFSNASNYQHDIK